LAGLAEVVVWVMSRAVARARLGALAVWAARPIVAAAWWLARVVSW
jgi:hypothetical protein